MRLAFAFIAAVVLGSANAGHAATYGCIDDSYNNYPLGRVDSGNECEDCTCTEYGQIVCEPKTGPLDSTAPCEICTCNDGHKACNAYACYEELDCPLEFQYREEGECCDKCKACRRGYDWYNVGETVDRGHKCETCVCAEDGDKYEVQCEHVPCPRLPCYPTQYVTAPDACCEHCPDGCKVGYAYHLLGEEVVRGKCEECTCGYGGVLSCTPVSCPRLYCDPENQVTDRGECCPRCAYN